MSAFEGFVIRGLLSGLLSWGPEELAAEINARWPNSVQISDHGWAIDWFSNVPNLINQSVAIHKSGKKLVLIGHSFGATSAIMVAQALNKQKIDVDLLCPIDPAWQYPADLVVPTNVKRCVGFFQHTPGQLGQGEIKEGAGWTPEKWREDAIDYRRYETHLQIVKDPWVHDKVLEELAKL